MQGRESRLFRLAISFVLLGLVPLLAAGTALLGHFRDNMEQAVLDGMGRMVSYGAGKAEDLVEECSDLTKYIYDVSTDDGMFLYQILKSPGLRQEERKMEITLLLNDVLDRDSRMRTVCFMDQNGRIYYATRNPQKVLDEDAFRYWAGKEDEGGNFSVLSPHADDYFPDCANQVITFRRSYQDITSFETIESCLGHLYMDMDVSRLLSGLSSADLGLDGSFYIMDDTGACIYGTDSAGTGKTADNMASLLPSMNQERGSLFKDRTYVVYERLERYGWTAAAKAGQDRILNMESAIRYIAVFLGAAFLAFLCIYSWFQEQIPRLEESLKRGMAGIRRGSPDSRTGGEDRESD